MAEEVLVDALPYFDSGYDEPGVKQAAFALIEEECRRYRPTKNYLDVLGPANLHLFETDVMKNEFKRLEQRLPMEVLSMKRYELPPPSAGKQTEVSGWTEAVENSYAQLEHQANRILNLEIMADYGPHAWRAYNQTLTTMFNESEKQLNNLKSQIQAVNLQRKNEQSTTGEKLRRLDQTWVGLVSKNYEIECALLELEKDMVKLKQQKKAQNLEEPGEKKIETLTSMSIDDESSNEAEEDASAKDVENIAPESKDE